jgi:hypothetical protein
LQPATQSGRKAQRMRKPSDTHTGSSIDGGATQKFPLA